MSQIRQHVWRHLIPLIALCVALQVGMAFGSERTFTKRFEVTVPARGLLQDPPSRDKTFKFELPTGYQIVRDRHEHGATVVEVNHRGLNEKEREITRIAGGVKLRWKLENPETFPINGRTAFIKLSLKGKRISRMQLSQKYRTLRKRFFDDFYYQGLVAAWIKPKESRIKFADQTIFMGQALMVLSTEMAILKDTGKDTRDTRKRIGEILSAIDQLDRKANVRYRSDNRDRLNGLFVRDDIIGSDDPRLGVRWKKVDSDWQNAGSENASPSGDQIFGLMYGLYCVVHYSGDDDLATHAKTISSRMYDYAKRNHFILRLPNGDPTKRGSDMRWLSSLLHGLNKSITGEDLWDESRIEVGPTKPPLNGIGAFWDNNHTPETIARLIGRKLAIPVIDFEADLNSFALHIMFMALAPSKVWSQKELEQTAIKANHQLSVLWYCHAHGKQPNRFNEQTIQEILDACPETGPTATNAPKTGWQTESRWIRCTRIYEPHTGDEVYNGLDWLVLHNFCQLVYFGGSK